MPVQGQIDHLLTQIRERTDRKERVLITTLTKRMAESLTDFLKEMNVKVRYLHSDIDTLERMEIIRICGWAFSMCWSASTCCVKA